MISLPSPAVVSGFASVGFPAFEYDLETFDPRHEGMGIQGYINAKAREGWRLHTIQRIAFDDHFQYFLMWDRLKRQGIAHEA